MGNVPSLLVANGLRQAVHAYNARNFTGGSASTAACGCGGNGNCKCKWKRRLFGKKRFRNMVNSIPRRKRLFRNCCGA